MANSMIDDFFDFDPGKRALGTRFRIDAYAFLIAEGWNFRRLRPWIFGYSPTVRQ